MPSLFSRIRGKDAQGKAKAKKNGNLDHLTDQLPPKPQWEDAYTRMSVEPEEVQDLIRRCTDELKARALDLPFLLLPFRPASDPSAVRTFIRHFFDASQNMRGNSLAQELRMTEPMVISGVLKWCWSRIQGGLVGWDAYELFKVGEQDSNMAPDAFATFIPLSVEDEARVRIIFDFFDLLSAISAHGKMNGLGGRKLSRMASWWAFEHKDSGNGFEGGYKYWLGAADATSHLFFAYLRSLSPQPSRGGISMLPMSLQKLLQETEYPPQKPSLMQSSTNKVVMIVDTVSPTPFALLRRANHFQYRDEDWALQEFSEYEDPIKALTEECCRVLKAISLANQSQVSSAKHSTSLRDASWSRFEDIGFAATLEEEIDEIPETATLNERGGPRGLRTTPASGVGLGRPTTPSWADFLSSGFVDDSGNPPNLLLPPDKVLPPIDANIRQRSSQSHRPRLESDRHLEPGELASITHFDLDESFWWVWMSSLAPEETAERKSAFGRCAVVETVIRSGRWLVMEEMVKGAAPEVEAGAYLAEKKGFFSWTRRNKGVSRRKSTGKRALPQNDLLSPNTTMNAGMSKTSIGPDQQARIQAAAQQLQAKRDLERQLSAPRPLQRRGRTDTEVIREKTNSVLTLQPVIVKEASPAMKWANKYDKESVREAYLANANAGRGLGQATMHRNGQENHASLTNGHGPEVPIRSPGLSSQPSPAVPEEEVWEPTRNEAQHSLERQRTAEVSRDLAPVERPGPTGRHSPLPPPPQEMNSMEAARENMLTPEPGLGQDGKKHKKLHKEEKEKKSGGGFLKLFGRNKNRSSKLPDNAANDLNGMLAQAPVAPQSPIIEEKHESVPSHRSETPRGHRGEITPTQTAMSPPAPERAYEASVEESISRIDTADAMEAKQEFSRFDQGPLSEQPAFVPDDDMSDDDATPPPIARHASNNPPPRESESIDEESAPSPSVPMQDRWAQIRKNAADRAQNRQSEEQSRGGYSKTTDGDDDTSGEETIESRVARIKARVAELTGNMDGVGGPGSRPSPTRR